jgi:hypothetical protein
MTGKAAEAIGTNIFGGMRMMTHLTRSCPVGSCDGKSHGSGIGA